MIFQQTTQVPNVLFDFHLPKLTESELKLLLVVIRQTNGWIDKRTGKRKTRDRISHGQFIQKTGLSRRVISKTLQTLVDKGLVNVTDTRGLSLHKAEDRKGMTRIFYAPMFQIASPKSQYRRSYSVRQIGEIMQRSEYKSILRV